MMHMGDVNQATTSVMAPAAIVGGMVSAENLETDSVRIFMSALVNSFIIIGQTPDGKTFRPSDWADRLCGIMSAFGADRKMKFSPYVRPGSTATGEKCVMVEARLYELEPLAYNFLVNFAKDNDLKVDTAQAT